MGWLFSQGQTKEELVESRVKGWERDTEDKEGNKLHVVSKCLDHSLRGNHLWSVWEVIKTPIVAEGEAIGEAIVSESHRYIALDLLASQKGYGWGYKDMDETCGPNAVDCPLKFLDMVPVPDSPYAAGWREKVRAYHADKKDKAAKRGKIVVGSRLRLIDGLTVNGMPLKEVSVVAVESRRILGNFMGRVVKIAPRYIEAVL